MKNHCQLNIDLAITALTFRGQVMKNHRAVNIDLWGQQVTSSEVTVHINLVKFYNF